MVNKVCKRCKKEFKTPSTKRKFHNLSCYRKFKKENPELYPQSQKNKTYEEMYNSKKIKKIKQSQSKSTKKMWKEIYADPKRLKKYSDMNRKRCLNKKWEDQYGLKKSEEMKRSIAKARTIHGRSIAKRKYLETHELACENCDKKGNTFNIVLHHKDENNMNNKKNNLILLCRKCHRGIAHYSSNQKRKKDKLGKFCK